MRNPSRWIPLIKLGPLMSNRGMTLIFLMHFLSGSVLNLKDKA